MPARPKKAAHGALLFDIEKVKAWLGAKGLLPGAHGREGGAAKAAQLHGVAQAKRRPHKKRAVAPPRAEGGRASASAGPAPLPAPRRPVAPTGDVRLSKQRGLDGTLERLETLELIVAQNLETALTAESANPLERTGLMRMFRDLAEQIRKTTEGVLKLRVDKRELVSRDAFRDSVLHLSAIVRAAVERFPGDLAPRVISVVGRLGCEVPELRVFQQEVEKEARLLVEELLRRLSEEIRATDTGHGSTQITTAQDTGQDQEEWIGAGAD